MTSAGDKSQATARHKPRSWPLALGAALGTLLAAYNLVAGSRGDPTEMPEDAVAMVNGTPVYRSDFERTLAAVAADRRGPVDAATERRVLDRLIEEELLVQRGLELGLTQRDRRLRAQLSAAVIDLLVARGEQQVDASEAQLRTFYEAQRDRFRRPPLQRVQWRQLGAAADEQRALEAMGRWRRGEPLGELSAPTPVELPDVWLTVAKLRDYVGPAVARATLELEVGEVSEPIRAGGGYNLVRVTARRPGAAQPFEQVREQVRAAWLREAGDERLRKFLDERRAASRIAVAEAVR